MPTGLATFTVRLINPSRDWSAQYPSLVTVGVTDAALTPAPIILANTASYSPVSGFSFSCQGIPNQVYRLWASTNLTDWLPIQTVTNLGAVFLLHDPQTQWPQRFYRVEWVP